MVKAKVVLWANVIVRRRRCGPCSSRIDSHTNFALLKTGVHAQEAIQHFIKNGNLLIPLVPFKLTYVHVSPGTPTEMKEFFRFWDLMPR
jgi:hypothetical protein